MPARQKRKNVRVKLPIRQAIEIEMTLRNVSDFCAVRNADSEVLAYIARSLRSITTAIDARNRVVGLKG